jgi:hypothetical protein
VTAHEATHLVVRISGWTFLAAFLLLGIWDLVLIGRGRLSGNSASGVILEVARSEPVWTVLVALAVGVLAGHFFWPQWRTR